MSVNFTEPPRSVLGTSLEGANALLCAISSFSRSSSDSPSRACTSSSRPGAGEHQDRHRQGDSDLDQRHAAVTPHLHRDRYFPAVEGPVPSPPWTVMSSPPPCALSGP